MPAPIEIPIDTDEVATLAEAFRHTSYHEHLERYVRDRIAFLLDTELSEPNAILKCRGQVEELQRLVVPLFVKSLALAALARRAEARATAEAAHVSTPGPRRDWWSDPSDELPVP